MTAGRGRPVVFDEPAQTEFLRLVAGGARIGEAAAKLGVGRRTPEQLARRDKTFARHLRAAKTEGQAARRHCDPAQADRAGHGKVSTYNNYACRCTRCREAAAKDRKARKDRQQANATAQIHSLPVAQPPTATTKFPVLADVS
ncbi:hypothetical protein [Streptomyces decoyicus]